MFLSLHDVEVMDERLCLKLSSGLELHGLTILTDDVGDGRKMSRQKANTLARFILASLEEQTIKHSDTPRQLH